MRQDNDFPLLLHILQALVLFVDYFSGTLPSAFDKYTTALMWSVQTMTTVGYGDVVRSFQLGLLIVHVVV